ncbi:MAG: hybrid sensor histidine kinase/response regulator, partial [Moorea sp. SIO4G2]|nr:hybrid sensor histidine kinase/response regulator [Moorena sp. SIO4G2]
MTNDPKIREQSYRYFLQEAPELLQVLEEDLLSLSENYSINKVNNLMRTTHTLKGAAASIGLETIATVAHSLEDVFKALFNPDLSIDPEIEALLFQAYECLRLPLTAELTGGQIDDTEIKNRTAAVVAQLQEKLGDCFGHESHLPTSLELGFDVTQSIFEVGVSQGLDVIQAALNNDNPSEISITVRHQADIFLGLGESLNLPGFAAIAKNAIAALDNHPDQVVTIAKTALCDFVAAQAAVLEGDRTQGGQPSIALQQLADLRSSSQNSQFTIQNQSSVFGNGKEQDLNRVELGLKEGEGVVNNSSVTNPESKTRKRSQLVEMIWGGSTTLDQQTFDQSRKLQRSEQTEIDVLHGEIASPDQEIATEKNFVLHNMGMID